MHRDLKWSTLLLYYSTHPTSIINILIELVITEMQAQNQWDYIEIKMSCIKCVCRRTHELIYTCCLQATIYRQAMLKMTLYIITA